MACSAVHRGKRARTVLTRDGSETELSSKQSLRLLRGDVLSYQLSGAGGYGPPGEREVQRIEADLADGFVTESGAQADYGVEISDGRVWDKTDSAV